MSKILSGIAAAALLAMLAQPAGAAERRADGLRMSDAAALTEFSSVRHWRHGYWRHRHYGYWRHRHYGWRHRYYPYYRSYAGYPYYGAYPGVSIGIGVGPRWWW